MALDYPINLYSRTVTSSSGTGDIAVSLLCHGDRATISSGTWFVDNSSWDSQVVQRGTSVYQATFGWFGSSSILFSHTVGDSTMFLKWSPVYLGPGAANTATSGAMTFTIEAFIYFVAFPTIEGTYESCVWLYTSGAGTGGVAERAQFTFLRKPSGQNLWKLGVSFFGGTGTYLFREWLLNSWATGTFHHFAVGRYNSFGGQQVCCWQNRERMQLVSAASTEYEAAIPSSSGTGNCIALANPLYNFPGGVTSTMGTRNLYFGGNSTATNGATAFNGYMDEIRVAFYGSGTNPPGLSVYAEQYDIPSAPYLPADGTFYISTKILAAGSNAVTPATDGGYNLGTAGTRFNNLWLKDSAYINALGTDLIISGTSRFSFYLLGGPCIYASNSANLVIAGTTLNLQIGLNFVGSRAINFDTVSGTKFGILTNEKLSFWNAAPITKPVSTADIKDSLVALGLISDSGATPLNLDGGTLTAGTISAAFLAVSTLSAPSLLIGTVSASGAVIGASGSFAGLLTVGTISATGAVIGASASITNLLTVGTLSVPLLTVGTVSASGALIGASCSITNLLIVVGTLSAGIVRAGPNGIVTAGNVSASNGVIVGSAGSFIGTVTMASLTVSKTITVGTLSASGAITGATGSFPILYTSGTMSGANIITTGNISVGGYGLFGNLVATEDIINYQGTSTLVGWGTITTKNILYSCLGRTAQVFFNIDGTSDSTAATFTVPYTAYKSAGGFLFGGLLLQASNNGAAITTPCRVYINAGENIIRAETDFGGTGWTNSGNKKITGSLFFPRILGAFEAQFEGPDAATSYISESGHTATFNGSTEIDTAEKRFGISSLKRSGSTTANNIQFACDTNFYFGTSTFKISFSAKVVTVDNVSYSVIMKAALPNTARWEIGVDWPSTLLIASRNSDGSSNIGVAATCTLSTGIWYDVQVVREGTAENQLYFKLDGISLAPILYAGTWNGTFVDISTGQFYAIFQYDGWLDNLIIER